MERAVMARVLIDFDTGRVAVHTENVGEFDFFRARARNVVQAVSEFAEQAPTEDVQESIEESINCIMQNNDNPIGEVRCLGVMLPGTSIRVDILCPYSPV